MENGRNFYFSFFICQFSVFIFHFSLFIFHFSNFSSRKFLGISGNFDFRFREILGVSGNFDFRFREILEISGNFDFWFREILGVSENFDFRFREILGISGNFDRTVYSVEIGIGKRNLKHNIRQSFLGGKPTFLRRPHIIALAMLTLSWEKVCTSLRL